MARFRLRLTLRRGMVLVAASAAVLTVLVGIGNLREDALRAQCANNLKHIGLALHQFNLAHDALPRGSDPSPLPPERRLGWRAFILAYHEQGGSGLPALKLGCEWDSPANLATITEREWRDESGKVIRVSFRRVLGYNCPCHKPNGNPKLPAPSSFVGIAGLGSDAATLPKGHARAGVFGNDRQTSFREITDGLANTMMVAETTQDVGPWTAGGRASIRGLDPSKPPYIGSKNAQFGGLHPGGANVLMADGSVKFIRATINTKTFEALATIAGRETQIAWPAQE